MKNVMNIVKGKISIYLTLKVISRDIIFWLLKDFNKLTNIWLVLAFFIVILH